MSGVMLVFEDDEDGSINLYVGSERNPEDMTGAEDMTPAETMALNMVMAIDKQTDIPITWGSMRMEYYDNSH